MNKLSHLKLLSLIVCVGIHVASLHSVQHLSSGQPLDTVLVDLFKPNNSLSADEIRKWLESRVGKFGIGDLERLCNKFKGEYIFWTDCFSEMQNQGESISVSLDQRKNIGISWCEQRIQLLKKHQLLHVRSQSQFSM